MYDTTDEAFFPEQPSEQGAAKPRLILSLYPPLLHEAFFALARRDDRFVLLKPVDNDHSESRVSPAPCVVLLDGRCCQEQVSLLLNRWRPVGGVLLVDADPPSTPDAAPLGPVRVGSVEMTVLGYDSAWSHVAKALLLASKGCFPSEAPQQSTPGTAIPKRRLADDLELYGTLTRREKEVLAEIGAGRSPREIAKHLNIAVSTAENHKSRLMRKTDFHKSVDLVRFAIRVGAAPV